MIRSAQFFKSSPDLRLCPASQLPEFAFIGRSNVGKSSLINMLTGVKDLARVSSSPGKTRLINFFLINEAWHLVDLPGYGYARVSKTERSKFRQSVMEYLFKREQLHLVFVLVDARLTPQSIDLEFINALGARGIPFVVVFTKTDKSSQAEWHRNVEAFRRAMLETWEELPMFFYTSALKKTGREEIMEYIEKTIP
jgi:GTP-binding protein